MLSIFLSRLSIASKLNLIIFVYLYFLSQRSTKRCSKQINSSIFRFFNFLVICSTSIIRTLQPYIGNFLSHSTTV